MLEAGDRGECGVTVNCFVVSSCEDENELGWWCFVVSAECTKTTELHSLNEQIVWYGNYISVNFVKETTQSSG